MCKAALATSQGWEVKACSSQDQPVKEEGHGEEEESKLEDCQPPPNWAASEQHNFLEFHQAHVPRIMELFLP